MIEQNKLPDKYLVKTNKEHPLWNKFADYINTKRSSCYCSLNFEYYGEDNNQVVKYDAICIDIIKTYPSLTLEKWDSIVNPKEEKYTIQQCIDQKIAIRCYNKEEGNSILKNYREKHLDFNFNGSNDFEIFPTKDRITNWQPNYSGIYFIKYGLSTEKLFATKCIEFKQVILDNMSNDTNQEIIGYKLVKELIGQGGRIWKIGETIYNSNKESLPYFKSLGLDKNPEILEPIFKPKYQLPEINGYQGKLEDTQIIYGCAKFDKGYLFNTLSEIIRYNNKILEKDFGNRPIKSIVLESGVSIHIDQIKQIVEYLNNNK